MIADKIIKAKANHFNVNITTDKLLPQRYATQYTI